jgi:hypothetical protein
MVTTLILILGGVLLAALAVIYSPRYERGSAENERDAHVTRLDHNVEVEPTRLCFSTRSTLKWRRFIEGRGGDKEERVKGTIWTFAVGCGASALKSVKRRPRQRDRQRGPVEPDDGDGFRIRAASQIR